MHYKHLKQNIYTYLYIYVLLCYIIVVLYCNILYSSFSHFFKSSGMYPESVNRNEDALSRISVPHLNPYSPYSDSVVSNIKSQSGRSSAMTQNNENVELRNVNIPAVANLSGNLDSIPAFTLPQNRNYAREDFCSNDLLTKHSPSIKEMEKKIRSLESKMKKFRKLKKKINKNNSYRSINCKDDMLNSNLISVICKSVMEYYDEKKDVCFKNKHDIDSEKCTCNTKETKIQQLNKSNNTCKNIFSCKTENCNEKYQVCNTFCNKVENVTKTCKDIDISPGEHTLSVHKNTLFSDINTSSMFLNNTDDSDKREIDLHEKNTLHLPEVVSIEDDLATSHLSTDKICTNDTLLDKDNVETIDADNKTEIETVLSKDKNSTDHVDGKITKINTEKNEIKNESQNIHEAKVDEVFTSDNLLSKDTVKAIDADNKTEAEIVLSNNKNSTNHVDGQIIEINAEENEIKNKSQNIHEDKVDEVCVSDNLLSKDNIEIMDNEAETGTIFVSNEHSTDYSDGKINDINIEKNIITIEVQNIHADKVDETYASDNLLNKNNVEIIDMDNQIKTETISSHNENSTDSKIIDIKVETNEIKSKDQNIHKNEIGKIYTNNLLSKNNIKAIDMDNQTKIGRISLYKNKNSIDHADSKIIVVNSKESKIKRKDENICKSKVGDRLLKKLRNLKRKTQVNSPINKQESVESYSDHNSKYTELSKKSRIENEEESNDHSLKNNINLKRKLDTRVESINKPEDNKLCSDDYEPVKKLRIAHTRKTSDPELSIKKHDFTHSTVKNLVNLMVRKNNINQLVTSIRKDNLLIESKKSYIINEKCDEKNVKSIETNNVSGKCKDVLIEDTMNRRISTDKVIAKMSSNDKPDASCNNIANNTTNLKLKEFSIPLKTCIITQSKSSTLCKNSRCDRLTEALETIETKKDMTLTAELEHETLGNKGHDDHKKSEKNAISNRDRLNMLKATQNLSNNYSDMFDRITEVRQISLRDSSIVEDDCTDDNNMKESLNEIKNADKQEKTSINNKIIRVQTQRKNICVSQQDEGMKFNDVSEVKDESQSPMSQLNKYINQKRKQKYKLPRKQISYVSKITGM